MGHLERFGGNSAPGGAADGTPGTVRRGFRPTWCRRWDTWNGSAGIPLQVVPPTGHLEQFGGDSAPGGAADGTPETVRRGFRSRWCRRRDIWNGSAGISLQVVPLTGHLEPCGGDSAPGGAADGTPGTVRLGSAPGGADDGTPGTVRRGFRPKWCRRWDTWNGSAGIPLQVVPPMGHLEQ